MEAGSRHLTTTDHPPSRAAPDAALPRPELCARIFVGYVGRSAREKTGVAMARIPVVADGVMLGTRDGEPSLAVGSRAWFAWLDADAARSFAYRSADGRYTARKEQRQRGGSYWVAYRTVPGRQHKHYLGRSEDLTSTRLTAVAVALAAHADDAPTVGPASPSRSVLSAKLLTPSLHPRTLTRGRLHELLDGAWDARLTTVVAPAGWGKTTLVAAWARDQPEHRPVAWLSLDEVDDDPARFWTYALSALARVAPEIARDALAAVRAPSLDPVQLALTSLLERLTTAPGECGLVLDDYHVLQARAIHETVEFLLTYLPPALHLVVASRADPPLPLARMRARGWLTEIRVADLRCTPSEGVAMPATVADVEADAAGALVERTDGWPAGLRLAALMVRNAGDPAGAAARIRGDERQLLDYVESEVLPGLDPRHRRLLVACSVLERLCGPLCDEVTGDAGSAASLEALEQAGAFVTVAGDGWYRCHPCSGRRCAACSTASPRPTSRPARPRVRLVPAAGPRRGGRGLPGRRRPRGGGGPAARREHPVVLRRRRHGRRRPAGRAPGARRPRSRALRGDGGSGRAVRPPRPVRRMVGGGGAPPLRRCGPHARLESSLRAWADTTWAVYGVPEDPEAALRHGRRAVELERDPAQWGYVVSRQALAGALRQCRAGARGGGRPAGGPPRPRTVPCAGCRTCRSPASSRSTSSMWAMRTAPADSAWRSPRLPPRPNACGARAPQRPSR